MLAGPHPRSLSRGDFAPRSGRRRFLSESESYFEFQYAFCPA